MVSAPSIGVISSKTRANARYSAVSFFLPHSRLRRKRTEQQLVWDSLEVQDMYPETPQRKKTDFLLWKMSVEIPKCHYLPLGEWESVLSAPVVEMLSFSKLPDSITPVAFQPLVEYIRATPGCVKVLAALTMQYGDGKDEKRFLIVVGWESVEAHEKGKKPEGFAKLPMPLWKKVEMHHVKWEKLTAQNFKAKL